MSAPTRATYLLVDGENIDMTLGGILGHRPDPEQRPRWQRLLGFLERVWGQPVRGLFFINASDGRFPYSFVSALAAIGYRPIPLSGPSDVKVVDVGIQRTLDALTERDGDVVLASHDGDFVEYLGRLAGGDRRIGVVGFAEYLNAGFREVDGLDLFDLEADVRAFDARLPRITIIPLDEFDPTQFL